MQIPPHAGSYIQESPSPFCKIHVINFGLNPASRMFALHLVNKAVPFTALTLYVACWLF